MTIEFPSRLSTLLLLLVALTLAPVGCDGGDGGDEVSDTTDGGDGDGDADTDTGPPDPANGEVIHDAMCAIPACHGPDDPEQMSVNVPMLNDQEIRDQVREGSTSPDTGMPPFNTNAISDSQLEDLLAFLRQMYP